MVIAENSGINWAPRFRFQSMQAGHMSEQKLPVTRREFLVRFCAAAAAAPFLTSFGSANHGRAAIAPSDSREFASECPDADLTAEQVKTREGLQYVDASPHKDKQCKGCRLYKVPEEKDAVCGGCQVVPGPIHPNGYCIAWAAAG